jgi:hypothetical protein
MATQNNTSKSGLTRGLIIGGLVVVAFFGAYQFAVASSGRGALQAAAGQTASTTAQTTASNGSSVSAATGASGNGSTASGSAAPQGSSAGGGACCGGGSSQPAAGGVTGPQVDGTAKLAGGVQAIAIKVTTVYSPNVIHLKAGVPAEITFSSAQGCTGQVQSQQLGFAEDLTSGPKVVTIKNPQAGTYDFACGMNMVHGKIVVE